MILGHFIMDITAGIITFPVLEETGRKHLISQYCENFKFIHFSVIVLK